jgi:hypothetical protein
MSPALLVVHGGQGHGGAATASTATTRGRARREGGHLLRQAWGRPPRSPSAPSGRPGAGELGRGRRAGCHGQAPLLQHDAARASSVAGAMRRRGAEANREQEDHPAAAEQHQEDHPTGDSRAAAWASARRTRPRSASLPFSAPASPLLASSAAATSSSRPAELRATAAGARRDVPRQPSPKRWPTALSPHECGPRVRDTGSSVRPPQTPGGGRSGTMEYAMEYPAAAVFTGNASSSKMRTRCGQSKLHHSNARNTCLQTDA